MPRFDSDTEMSIQQIGGSNFQFSAAKIETLGATEYTLATLALDCSGSVDGFTRPMNDAVKEVVKALRRSPRADNLMLRVITFENTVKEVHGFKPLMDCNEGDYDDVVYAGGTTALHDAVYNGVKAMTQYGKDLVSQDFQVNGTLFVITDGWDNASKTTSKMVKDAMSEAKTSESLESLMPVLVGVNLTDPTLQSNLDAFRQETGFQQFVALTDASEKTLAKLGGFISRSISSQSQALGSGGSSQSLSF